MPRNKHSEETVQKILDAALKLFLEKGYEQTTVLDIVADLGGLTRGAFYHHFKSKEEVLDALGDKMFFDDNPFEKAKQQKGLSGLEKLQYLLISSHENEDKRKIDIMSVQALKSPVFLGRLIDNNRFISSMYQELIEEGMRDGSIKTEHPKLLAELIPILTNFWMIPTIYPSLPKESVERLLYVSEIINKLGMPLLDDKIIALVMENITEIDKN